MWQNKGILNRLYLIFVILSIAHVRVTKASHGDGLSLLEAIDNNTSLAVIQKAIAENPGALKGDGETTPLHAAVIKNRIDIIKVLLTSNADINVTDKDGNSALHLAILDDSVDIDIIELLLDYDTNRNNKAALTLKGQYGCTLLHCASIYGTPDIVDLLLARGARINEKDNYNNTPLHWAIAQGNIEIAELLLNYNTDSTNKADINAQGEYGYTPLHRAIFKNQADTVKLLLDHGAHINAADNDTGETPLHYAIIKGHADIIEILLKRGADTTIYSKAGNTPLHAASELAKAHIVELLLNHNAHINAKTEDKYGYTPLHCATLENRIKVVELLLNRNADINAKANNKYRSTPLHSASMEGNTNVVQLLLDYGTDSTNKAGINVQDDKGDTPLHWAFFNHHTETAQLLLSRGADTTIRNKDNKTPLDYAQKEEDKPSATPDITPVDKAQTMLTLKNSLLASLVIGTFVYLLHLFFKKKALAKKAKEEKTTEKTSPLTAIVAR